MATSKRPLIAFVLLSHCLLQLDISPCSLSFLVLLVISRCLVVSSRPSCWLDSRAHLGTPVHSIAW